MSDLRRIWMLSPPIFVFSRQHCSKRRNTIMARSCTVLVCKILLFFLTCLPKPNQSRSETSLNRLTTPPNRPVQSTKQPVSILDMCNYSASLPDGPRPKVHMEKGEPNTTGLKNIFKKS